MRGTYLIINIDIFFLYPHTVFLSFQILESFNNKNVAINKYYVFRINVSIYLKSTFMYQKYFFHSTNNAFFASGFEEPWLFHRGSQGLVVLRIGNN